jgi:hypothetical protein
VKAIGRPGEARDAAVLLLECMRRLLDDQVDVAVVREIRARRAPAS